MGNLLEVAEESWRSVQTQWPELSFDEFPLLAGVDTEARTMFNRLQMESVLQELDLLLVRAPKGRIDLISKLIEMSRVGAETIDAELWFLGD